MKRVEMIELIDLYLMREAFEEGVRPIDFNGAWDSWKSAENILDIIEKAGMQPPTAFKYESENIKIEYSGWDESPFVWEKEKS